MIRLVSLFIYIAFIFSNSPINNFIIGFWPEYDHPGVLVSIQIESDPNQLPFNLILDVPNNAKMVIETIINDQDRINNVLNVELNDNNSSYISTTIKSQKYLLQYYFNPFLIENDSRDIIYNLSTNIDLYGFYVVIQKHLGAVEYKINLENMETIEDKYGITYYRKKIDQLFSKDSLEIKINYKNQSNITTMDILNQTSEKSNMTNNELINKNMAREGYNRYYKNKLYILIIMIITTIIIIILYLIYNRDNYNIKNYLPCKNCKKLINNTDLFCSFCGGKNVS